MEFSGNIKKMQSALESPVLYHLPVGDDLVAMNALLGKKIQMEFLDEINCVKCGRLTKKSFSQGFCYPCFVSAPETEECVLRPELCRAQEGQARDMEYAKQHCLIEHVVYLSLTSDVKVGVTRNTQVPTRWIDQGAVQAIELARTPNRYLAGRLEVFLKGSMKDKTNWRAMLKNEQAFAGSLQDEKRRILSMLPEEYAAYRSFSDDVTEIEYPVLSYPQKVLALNFDKDRMVEGSLLGVKGQYLLFEEGKVLNVRKFGGYKIRLSY